MSLPTPAPDMEEALRDMIGIVDSFHAFCRDPKRPCGEYGVECPISMGEWIEAAEVEKLERARALLSLKEEGRIRPLPSPPKD